eukprot:CAMPEP_0201742372 /NCGR_PEP_ID=MMETSP0593-20130828/47287_1 /ASSEMBLY_ACC=CAM_ASM_000672 /TAXON_ID=267983 /ORGANISM="Skeletonema japonicum, Strain CCMP2506" /LENGTH=1187 /DNA_ID=CAMNT_0048236725 /DNA_START=179 /DNA_END=3742 /DNA_ORIENTATION=-
MTVPPASRRCIVCALSLFFAALSCLNDTHAATATNDNDTSTFSRAMNGCVAQDNECGPTKGPCVTGECCSQFGWCGTEGDSFCGECCQHDCDATTSNVQSQAVQSSTTLQQAQAITPTDRAKSALLKIYSQCNGRNWERKEHWASDNIPLCTWEGVTCSASGDIIEISLRTNGLTGEFPTKEVFDGIPTLTALSLEGNDDLMFSFLGVDKVTKLESLDVSKTRFDSFDGVNLYFTQLQEVYAARCGLMGSFPSALLDISRLERLDLSFNHMMGELPRDIGIFFSKMQVLFLHDNQFSGALPDSLDNMEELKYIQLDSNKFSGRVPSFANARSIVGIDIRNQKAKGGGLIGPIPTNFLQSADGSTIQYINLSSNHISGELPASLARIPTATMDFSDNEIEAVSADLCGTDCALVLCAPTTYSDSGRQPSPVENCLPCPSAIYWGATSCGTVTMPSNSVVNNNPVTVAGNGLGILKSFYADCGGDQWKNNENWSGDDVCSFWGITCIPTESGPKSVMSILLPSNNLKCTVSAHIFFLPKLQTLVLDGNDIEMNFASIHYAKSLETLSLAFTGISNVDGINQAPSLRKLDMTNNKFERIPSQIFQISTMHELYLGGNSFSLSPIPNSIGDLTELRLFECSSCHLNGKIPATISALKNLVSLNLEGNLMNGPLPEGLEALNELSFVNLAGNYFDGQLPSFRSSTKLRRVDLSNNAFTGAIPSNFMESVNTEFFEYLNLKGNDLVGTAPGILSRLEKLDISDNFISELDSDLCDNSCGCDCVACGIGFYNAAGRQDSELNPCLACSGAAYYGQTSCSDEIHSWDDEKQVNNVIESPNPTSIEDEMEALIDFYESCAGNYWTSNEAWVKENYGHCEWYGIKCHPETGSVVSISLGSNNVQCVVEGLFDSLPNLSSLSLNSNPLRGFDFKLLEQSQSLKELNLDATGISSIEGIHHSSSLEAISLRFNNLRQIAELSMVSSLKNIRVSHNQLSSLPSFDNLQNLQTIIADNNKISGGLDGISFPPNLSFLDLSNNAISSVPSTTFSAVPSSASLHIDLSENKIDSLPYDLCDKGKWNDGNVGKFGCNGLLCGKGHYSKYGRQTSDLKCNPCRSASSFLGATTCADPVALKGSNRMPTGTASFLVIMSIILFTMLLIIIVGVHRQRHQKREDERVFIAPTSQYRDTPQFDDNEII